MLYQTEGKNKQMKCVNCKADGVVKVFDSDKGFRGINRDDKDIYACPKCHASTTIDRLTSQVIVSVPVDGKVGGKRSTMMIPFTMLSHIK